MPLDTQPSSNPRLYADDYFVDLGAPTRIWAVGGIYGRYGALGALHEFLKNALRPADKIIYLGNYLGPHSAWTGEGLAVIDEMMAFKNTLISVHNMAHNDVIFLKGAGEDLLIQALRFAFQPPAWLDAALAHGLEHYLLPYGLHAQDMARAAQQGRPTMNHLSHTLDQAIRAEKGHKTFYTHLKKAAVTTTDEKNIGFTPAGYDPALPLYAQDDTLCWPQTDCATFTQSPAFSRIVRGQSFTTCTPDPQAFVITLDDGLGMDGHLYAACLASSGLTLDCQHF